jgi:SAM-dependent methyltransferase
MGWQEAGIAWSGRALDWAYLMEPLFAPAYEALGTALELESTHALLDVGCGAGRGLQRYAPSCATVAGVDAAEGLLSIARSRVPNADLRQGSMTSLPWADATFDAITGVNSFMYADDGGLAEAFRVLKPGGRLGIGFWADPMDFGWAMGALGKAIAPYVGPENTHTPLAYSEPEVASGLLAAAGFTITNSGSVACVSEFPDADTAYRALASTGMVYPLVQNNAEDDLRHDSMKRLEELNSSTSGIRMAASLGWLIARRAD